MKKETMLTYTEQRLVKEFNEFALSLDWNKRERTIEIVFSLFADNKTREIISDIAGEHSQEAVVEFEDSIVLYNPEKTTVDEKDFLAAIPYQGKKGIEKAVLDGLISYLNEVLTKGQKDLVAFLSDETQEIFELNWSEPVFK